MVRGRKILGIGSFSDYFQAAMRLADYEELEDNEGWCGTIPGFDGLWAAGATEEECRIELRSTLEDWVLFSLHRQLPIPNADGIDLNLSSEENVEDQLDYTPPVRI